MFGGDVGVIGGVALFGIGGGSGLGLCESFFLFGFVDLFGFEAVCFYSGLLFGSGFG